MNSALRLYKNGGRFLLISQDVMTLIRQVFSSVPRQL